MTAKQLVPDDCTRPFQVRRIGIFIIKEPAYIIDVLAEKTGIVITLMGLQIVATHAYKEVDVLDTLIIAGGFVPAKLFPNIEVGDPSIFKNPELMAWIRAMSTQVRRLGMERLHWQSLMSFNRFN